MLKLGKVTKVKVLFVVRVFVFNFDLFKFSAAILEKGLFIDHKVNPPFYIHCTKIVWGNMFLSNNMPNVVLLVINFNRR